MSRLRTLPLLLLVVAFHHLPFEIAHAESDPRALVQRIVNDMKEERSPSVILAYVHWPTAYADLPVAERTRMRVSSPEGMRRYFERFFTDPRAFLQEDLANRPGLTASEREDAAEEIEKVVELMTEKQGDIRRRIERTTYQVEEPRITGNRALVQLVSSLDGVTHREPIALVRINGDWYLPSPAAGPHSQPEAGAKGRTP